MKSWELTAYLVPHLKAVLSAVERTHLDCYGIDRNFKEIEDALISFLAKLREAKEAHRSVHQLENRQGTNYVTD